MEIKAPRGTKDLSPNKSYQWQYVEGRIREIASAYHYGEVRTPIFEHTELFLRGIGDTTDVVQKEMYTFLDKGGRSITLRPEGTAGVVRCFIESGLVAGPQPTKMYYLSAPVFRYENPQAGRLRQHHQFGVEVFGAKDASADAEVVVLALSILQSLGVNNLALHINSIGCKNCRPQYNRALKEYYTQRKDLLCKTCLERLEKNPLRLLDCKEENCSKLAAGAPVITDHLCQECADHFAALQEYLSAAGVEYSIDPKIVRGLDYYTKTVFEIVSKEIGAQGTVCGGGRYDGLIAQIGGPAMPGVGFGMGIERLLMVMEGAGVEIPLPPALQVFICTIGQEAKKAAFQTIRTLRSAGISADMDHGDKSMKAQFKYADKIHARYTLTIGDEELQNGRAKLREMATGAEKEVSLSNPLAWI